MDNHGLFTERPRSQAAPSAWVIGTILLGILAALAPLLFSSGPATAKVSAAVTYVPQTRTYYIAANEVEWNYAPSGKNQITGEPFDEDASVFTKQGPDRIGSTYIKSLYQAYTDTTFKTLKKRTPAEEHLGYQGPVIRGVVGDTIKVVFKNNLDRPASVHVHGVFYDKSSEGAPYADGTSGAAKNDDGVAPGATYTYSYEVPERAGPGPMDGSSVMWMYHSHTDEVADDYSGLVGPMVITKASAARADGTPNDVDREFFLQFKVSDENASPYLERNIAKFTGKPATVNVDDEEFGESNLMHSINGYVYGNEPVEALTMKKGERVRWYLMGMGTEVDLHTPHWHGNTVTALGMRTDVVNLLPASMVVADMVPDDVGTWLFHCHVNDHISAGMITRYRVLNADGTEGGVTQAAPDHTATH
ncbi:multicopper oxidase domain-containing protein [Arthrobacter sp. IA7]|uniref:multicopper oxidase domain-containing protein n=1 Tax=Arthrobacter ipis TaxID=2716202 RepID=UPI001681C9E6|nr:multicopper oxidase domain-containing protein [Arthrobacter ipis]MBD1541908.1 multicopper oxidase domain-containing protein [Arthrobacter ipis]